MRTALYYTLYDESLELTPEKPERGGERKVDGNISIKQITRAKSKKNLKKGGKKKKEWEVL
jgi:hypothetical protein